MSEKVEKRIVELDFDNEKFKRGISETLNGMKKLDNAFDLSKGTKSVNELDKAINDIDTEKLSSGVERVKAEFSILGAIGFSAINKITGAVLDLGAQMVNSVTFKPITDGLDEYTLKMNSIKTIQTNTMGKSSLDDINKALAELNEYADKTIYNFAEMTNYVGKFTAAGVDLKQSTVAIQGISNIAAASGASAQNASSAMYNLSQSLATGRLQAIDWKSVEYAGMGGQLFQNALLRTSETMKAMGEIDIGGIESIAAEGNFRDSLKTGWASNEVLMRTLRNFTLENNEANRAMLLQEGYTEDLIEDIFAEAKAAQDAATKVKTFQQLVGTTQEALGSGWAQTWEYIIGDIQEAENFFTMVNDAITGVIESMTKARNDLFKSWHDNGGRDALIMTLVEFSNVIQDLAEPIAEAFKEVFKPISGEELAKGTKGLLENVRAMRSFFEESEAGKSIINGLKNVFVLAFTAIKTVGEVVFTALKTGFTIFIGIIGTVAKAIDRVVTFFDETGITSTIIDTFDLIGKTFNEIKDVMSEEFLKPIGDAIGNGLKNALGFLKTIDLAGIFNGVKDSLFGIVNSISDVLGIKKAFADVGVAIGDSSENADSLGDNIRKVAQIVRDTGISAIGNGISFVFDRLKDIWNFISPVLISIKDGLVKTFEIIKTEIGKSGITFEPFMKFFESLKTGLEDIFKNGVNLDTISKFISNIGSSFGDLVGNVGPKFIDLMGNVGKSLSEQVEGPMGTFYNMLTTLGELLFSLPDKIMGLPNAIGSALSNVSGLIRNPFAVEKAYADDGLTKGVEDIANTGGDAIDSLSTIAKTISNPLAALKTFFTGTFATFTKSIGSAIDQGIAAINFENIRSFILEVGSIAALAGSIWGIYEFDMLLNTARSFLTNVSNTIAQMTEVLKSIKASIDTLTKTMKQTARANNFLKYVLGFAGSILILAGALYLISTIDSNKLWPAVGALGVMMLVMGAFVVLFEFLAGEKASKIFSTAGGSSAILTIMGMAISMLLLANAISKLGTMDPGQLQQGMQSVILLMLIIGVMVSIIEVVGGMSDGMSGAASLIAMAIGLTLLVKAVQTLSDIPWDVLLNNLGKAAVMLVVLIGAIGLLNVVSKRMVNVLPALIGLSIGIGALAGALILLNMAAGDDTGKLLWNVVALSIGIVALGVAMKIISGFQGSMIKGGAGIAIMAGALIEMSLALGLLNLATGGNIGAMAVQLTILVGALFAISLILSFLGNAGPRTTAAAMSIVIITAALAGFVGLIILMGLLPWEKVAQGLGLMLAALLEFALMIVALSYLSKFIVTLGLSLTSLGIALALIAGAFLAFGLALSILAGLAPAAFANIADGIVAFADRIAAGGDAIIRSAQVFGEAFAMMIVGFFGRLAEEIGKGITNISNSVQGKEGEIFEAAKSLTKALIAGFVGGLAGIGELILNGIAMAYNSIVDGIDHVANDIGKAITGGIAQSVKDNPDACVEAVGDNMDAMDKSMANTDAGTEGGEKIAENTAEGYEQNIDSEMGEVDASDALAAPIENADPAQATEAMKGFFGDMFNPETFQTDIQGFGSNIPTDLVSGIFDGSKGINVDPAELLGNMGLNGENLSQQGTSVGNDIGSSISAGTLASLSSPDNVNSGVNTQLDSIRGRSGDYEAVGREHGSAYTGGVSAGVAESGTDAVVSNAVSAFSSGIPTAGEVGAQTGREYGARQIEAITSMGTVIAMTVKTNLMAAADQSDPVGSGHLVGTRQAEGTSQGIASKTDEITNTISAGLLTAAQNADPGGKGDTAGTWFANGAQYGVANNIGRMTNTVAGAFVKAASDSDPGGKGHQAGEWFDRGMASGIDNNVWYVREAAARAARAAKDAADAELDSHSPSREMMKRGRWFDEGIAIGMDQYRSVVSNAAAGVADDAISNTSTAMGALGGLVDGIDWDADPVITPVLDLDSFRADAATMSSFMPDSQVVSANMISRLGNESTSMQIDQNETQNGNNIYVTLDWKAGSSANQMVSELADELKLLNLTGGR